MKPTMFVFMGGQGSGKGTFANLLLKQHDYKYIETGDILRKMPSDCELCKKIYRGELVSDEDLFPIISENLATQKDVIMDGFPRTLGQSKWLIENYANKFDIKILFLDITEQRMLEHIQKRIREGGNRKDDSDETAVQKRLTAFKTTTIPAIQWLSTVQNIKFYDIKLPSDDIDINFKFILNTIK